MGIIKNFFTYNPKISFPIKAISILLLLSALLAFIGGVILLIMGVGVGISLYVITVAISSLILSYGLGRLRRWAVYLFGILAIFYIIGSGNFLFVLGFIVVLIYRKDFEGAVIPGIKERYILIAGLLVILIGVGFFAWQYFQKSKDEINDNKTIWKEYQLEEITDEYESLYFMDRRLIGTRDDGQKDVIVSSMRKIMGWEEVPREAGFYPVEVSFPLYSPEIYFVKFLAGTGHAFGFFALNVNTLEYRELQNTGFFMNYLNSLYRVSSDGFYIATLASDDNDRGLLYLENLKEDKITKLVIASQGERFFIGSNEPEFKWLDENTIQYPVYPSDSFERIEFRRIRIDQLIQDEIVDWKIYRSEEFGFEMKYPLYFSTEVSDSSNVEQWIRFENEKWVNQQVHSPSIILRVIKTPLSVERWFEEKWTSQGFDAPASFRYIGVKNIRQEVFGEIYGLRFDAISASETLDYVLIEGGNSELIEIVRVSTSLGTIPEKTFDQMLSMFRFIDINEINKEQVSLYFANIDGFGVRVKFVQEVKQIEDINNDGYDEVFVSAFGSGGSCIGGTTYKALYSKKDSEYFIVAKSFLESLPYTKEETFCTIINQNQIWESCGDNYLDYICFSNNLKEKKNSVFKEYLENSLSGE